MHMASAATPVCLGEWSGTPETSKELSKNGFLSLFWKVFEEPREFLLSKFHVDFCSEGFPLLTVFLVSSLKEDSGLILQQPQTIKALQIILIIIK